MAEGLPEGWEMRKDPRTNIPYFIDHNTKTTTWIHPAQRNQSQKQPPKPQQHHQQHFQHPQQHHQQPHHHQQHQQPPRHQNLFTPQQQQQQQPHSNHTQDHQQPQRHYRHPQQGHSPQQHHHQGPTTVNPHYAGQQPQHPQQSQVSSSNMGQSHRKPQPAQQQQAQQQQQPVEDKRITAIRSVEEKTKDLSNQVDEFARKAEHREQAADRLKKTKLLLEELLMRELLSLDNVVADGSDTIRTKRKAAVKSVQDVLKKLEAVKC